MNIIVCNSLLFFCFNNVHFAVSITYSCDRNAKCGCSKVDAAIGKTAGIEGSAPNSWGWAVSLQWNSMHFCAGVIISRLFVITAAHCFDEPVGIVKFTKVVTNIHRLGESTSAPSQVRSVAAVFLHPKYNHDTNVNDIAILQLNQPLYISHEMGTARVCMPRTNSTDSTFTSSMVNSSLVVIGWGLSYSEQEPISDHIELQQATVYVLAANHRTCSPLINDRKLQFCAGIEGGRKDKYGRDSGGPLMYFNAKNRQWTLVGITSYGVRYALADNTRVYTRVSAYLDWIKTTVNDGMIEIVYMNNNSIRVTPSEPNLFFVVLRLSLIIIFIHN